MLLMNRKHSVHEYTQIGSICNLEKDNQVIKCKYLTWNRNMFFDIYMVDICINNSLPVNALSFVLVICLMDAADIERAKNKIKRHHSQYVDTTKKNTHTYLAMYKRTWDIYWKYCFISYEILAKAMSHKHDNIIWPIIFWSTGFAS